MGCGSSVERGPRKAASRADTLRLRSGPSDVDIAGRLSASHSWQDLYADAQSCATKGESTVAELRDLVEFDAWSECSASSFGSGPSAARRFSEPAVLQPQLPSDGPRRKSDAKLKFLGSTAVLVHEATGIIEDVSTRGSFQESKDSFRRVSTASTDLSLQYMT
jgi:hypothetical protein